MEKQAKRRGEERTDVSMYAHLGTRVPSGTGFGKLEWKIEHECPWKRHGSRDLRSWIRNSGAIVRPRRITNK